LGGIPFASAGTPSVLGGIPFELTGIPFALAGIPSVLGGIPFIVKGILFVLTGISSGLEGFPFEAVLPGDEKIDKQAGIYPLGTQE
jgi:hypothetical protein